MHIDIISIECTIDFVNSKLKDFFKERMNNRSKNNAKLITMSSEEIREILDFAFLNEITLQQYIYRLLSIQINSLLEQFLIQTCLLIEDESEIKKMMNKFNNCVLKACSVILKNKGINIYANGLYNDLNSWRIIRNSIVHKDSRLEKRNVIKVSKIVKIDYTIAPNEYFFIVDMESIKNYLVLVKNFAILICDELFIDFDKKLI